MNTALKFYSLFSFIILLFFAEKSFAQYPGMAAFRAQQNRQFMNQQMRTQMQMMSMRGNWQLNANEGDEYIVTLKDSTQKDIFSYMYQDTVTHKNFLLYVDDNFKKSDSTHHFQKIYPDQTLYIAAKTVDNLGGEEKRYGVPIDSCWEINVISGAITVFAKSSNYLDMIGNSKQGNLKLDFYQPEIIGFQYKDGPVEKLTKENILKVLTSNAKAIELADKKGLYEAVKRYNRDAEKAAKK